MSQARGLTGDTLEDVVDEGVHDPHRLGGDTGVGVDLLQHLVHVDGIALLSGLAALLPGLTCGLGDCFLGALLRRGFGSRIRHDEASVYHSVWLRYL